MFDMLGPVVEPGWWRAKSLLSPGSGQTLLAFVSARPGSCQTCVHDGITSKLLLLISPHLPSSSCLTFLLPCRRRTGRAALGVRGGGAVRRAHGGGAGAVCGERWYGAILAAQCAAMAASMAQAPARGCLTTTSSRTRQTHLRRQRASLREPDSFASTSVSSICACLRSIDAAARWIAPASPINPAYHARLQGSAMLHHRCRAGAARAQSIGASAGVLWHAVKLLLHCSAHDMFDEMPKARGKEVLGVMLPTSKCKVSVSFGPSKQTQYTLSSALLEQKNQTNGLALSGPGLSQP